MTDTQGHKADTKPMGDVEGNVFMSVLKTGKNKRDYYHPAADNRHSIFLPSNSSLVDLYNLPKKKIDSGMLKDHIMKQSSRTTTQLVTLSNKVVEINESDQSIQTVSGWPVPRTVSILDEETFYNEKLEAFAVYIISEPLSVPKKFIAKRRAVESSSVAKLLDGARSIADLMLLLQHEANNKALEAITADVFRFKQGYILLRENMSGARQSVEGVIDQGLQRLVADNKVYTTCLTQPKHLGTLHRAVAHFVVESLQAALYTSLYNVFREEQDAYSASCVRLQVVCPTPLELGAALGLDASIASQAGTPQVKSIAASMSEAIVAAPTPHEVLSVIKHHVDRTLSSLTTSGPMVTDDILPLVAMLLLEASPRDRALMVVVLQFCRHFLIGDAAPEHEYYLSTFEAAVKQILHTAGKFDPVAGERVGIPHPPRAALPPAQTHPTHTVSMAGLPVVREVMAVDGHQAQGVRQGSPPRPRPVRKKLPPRTIVM